MSGHRKAVFWDKDGTLIPDLPYNVAPDLITLFPDAADGLRQLRAAGYGLVVVSNQAGVARGRFPEEALTAVWQRLTNLLSPVGAAPDAFYYCPHHPEGSVTAYRQVCSCRKPAPGMLLQAAEEWGLDLGPSWMVGDILNDVEAGNRAGCRTILIDRGNETEWLPGPYREPTYTVGSIREAVGVILANPPVEGKQRDAL